MQSYQFPIIGLHVSISNGLSIQHESEAWRFQSPSGQDIFCLKNFDAITRTICQKLMLLPVHS